MSIAPSIRLPSRVFPQLPLGAVADALMMHRFTVADYQKLIETGILPEDGSHELLSGIIVKKDTGVLGEEFVSHKPPHALVVTLLSQLIARINGPRCHLRIQLPVIVSGSDAPEPDGSIVRGCPRDYAERLPAATDTLCVIEVAHSSLERDEREKLPAYAEAGIAQYVLINLRSNSIELFSDPNKATGEYETKTTIERAETVDLNLGDGEILQVAASELLL